MPSKSEEFSYIDFPSDDLLQWPESETYKQKFVRKTKENPFVPIGLGVTVVALGYGLWQMKTGDKAMSQKMMRLRIGAQSFTIAALLGGVAYSSYKAKVAKERSEPASK